MGFELIEDKLLAVYKRFIEGKDKTGERSNRIQEKFDQFKACLLSYTKKSNEMETTAKQAVQVPPPETIPRKEVAIVTLDNTDTRLKCLTGEERLRIESYRSKQWKISRVEDEDSYRIHNMASNLYLGVLGEQLILSPNNESEKCSWTLSRRKE